MNDGEELVLDQRFLDQLAKLEEIGYTLTARKNVELAARLSTEREPEPGS